MSAFEKVSNILCIILAWILSIVLVLMLTVVPVTLSALSLLNTKTITKIVTDTLTQSLIPADEEDAAADYTLSKLSNTSQVSNADTASGALGSILGDQVSPEILEKLLSSKAAQEIINTYIDDVTNAFTGSGESAQLNAQKVKSIVSENMDEIVEIVRQLNPNMTESDIVRLKDAVTKAVDEQAEDLVQMLPQPEEIKQELIESSPELKTAFDIVAKKDTIKLAIVGVVVLLSGLIFVCRLWGFRGFRWLAADLFVGGGLNGLVCVGLLLGSSAVKQMVADQPVIGGAVGSMLSSLTVGMVIRTVVMLAAAVGLLLAYIFIKKARAAKQTAAEDKYDIIVLAGQSNAEGQGIGEVTEEYVPDERVHIMRDDANPKFSHVDGVTKLVMKWAAINTITVADERVTAKGKLGCFGLWFAKKYADTYLEKGRKVLIVNANFGGTGFHRPEWGVGNIMHERLLTMTKAALSGHPENRVVALLWAQGEHDSVEDPDWEPEKRYAVHKENLTATFSDFYEKLGDRAVPVIACGFPDTFCQSWPEATDAVLKAIREVIADFDGGFVETEGLASNAQKMGSGDIYHYCKESLRILGGKFFEEYCRLRKDVPVGK